MAPASSWSRSHDTTGDAVAAQVRLEGVGHRRHDLERVGMEAGVIAVVVSVKRPV
jgi:hypothetical protein